SGSNYALINFQRSVKSNSSTVVFTLNVGVSSGRLLRFSGRQVGFKPAIEDCHWRLRVGDLLQEAGDKWWTVDLNTPLQPLADLITEVLVNKAVPEIEKHVSDGSLRDLWLSGASPGLNEFERLKNLSVLLKALGPPDRLEAVLEEMSRLTKG